MNKKLIKRIDKLIKIIESGDTLLNGTTWEILYDCRTEIERLTLALKDSQALNLKFAQSRETADAEIERLNKPVRYVPMTETEFDELSAQWPGEDEVKIYCWEKHIEREVIRRAGLKVQE